LRARSENPAYAGFLSLIPDLAFYYGGKSVASSRVTAGQSLSKKAILFTSEISSTQITRHTRVYPY
jgi:hypothetical protein